MQPPKKYDLEDRVIDFAVVVLTLAEQLPTSYACTHLCKQIIRSGTAPALLYGEAKGAESTADFIHKMRVALKELRETHVNLKIIRRKQYLSEGILTNPMRENYELIAIFNKSVHTAKQRLAREKEAVRRHKL